MGDLILQFHADRLVAVEFLKHAEELRQVIVVFKIFVDGLELVQDLDEVAHNVREYRDPKQKDERAEQPLWIAFRGEVAEANRRKRSEGIVRSQDSLLVDRVDLIVLVHVHLQMVVLKEELVVQQRELRLREVAPVEHDDVLRNFAKDKPEHAHEVADVEDQNDHLGSLDNVPDVEQQLDAVVVFGRVFCQLWAPLDELVHARLDDPLYHLEEGCSVEDLNPFWKPHDLDDIEESGHFVRILQDKLDRKNRD